MRTLLIVGFFFTLAFGGAIGYFFGYGNGFDTAELKGISSFEECVIAGFPIMESYPAQCATSDGKHFVQEISPEEEWDPPLPHTDLPVASPPSSGSDRPIGSEPVACTMDAKICPDGSAVGRMGPNCEFAPCPDE